MEAGLERRVADGARDGPEMEAGLERVTDIAGGGDIRLDGAKDLGGVGVGTGVGVAKSEDLGKSSVVVAKTEAR